MRNRFDLPYLGYGLGLRTPHYEQVLKEKPPVGWFEILSENYLEAHPGYWEYLTDLRRLYPLVMHGVSLSIGNPEPLNMEYLGKLKALADKLKPAWVSDHLCYTGMHGVNTHDLLPLPYTEEAYRHIVPRVRRVQDILGRPLVLENPSTYLEFNASRMPEWEFLTRIAEASDCGILLDVNNIYVSSFNHGWDPYQYIDAIPADRIVQIHLAGHKNMGTHIIDTHDNHVIEEVWDLYAYTIRSKGPITTMIEWDENIPPLDVLVSEMRKAETRVEAYAMAMG